MQHLSSTYDLLTGSALISYRLSLSEYPWSAHRKDFDRVSLVGTGLLELALTAGRAVGSPRVLELTLAAPLLISTASRSLVKIQVQAADAQGHRAFSLHGLDEASGAEASGWILHATGVLAGSREETAGPLQEAWPPEATTQLDVSNLYARLTAQGLDCGPALQGRSMRKWLCPPARCPVPESTAFAPRFLILPCMCWRRRVLPRPIAACCFPSPGRT